MALRTMWSEEETNVLIRQQVQEASEFIRQRTDHRPGIGLVLGSGLGALAASVEDSDVIPFSEIPHFPRSTVEGHAGRVVVGRLADRTVLVMDGRIHFYEGYTMQQVTIPVRVMQALNIHTLILTNAAGGLNPVLRPGDLMLITDHIGLAGMAGQNPLYGPNDDSLGPRFTDMTVAYDYGLRCLALRVAEEKGLTLRQGVYVHVSGPNYETPAEVRFLRTIGGDAVGMSTVSETLAARHGGLRVLALSSITNMAQAGSDAASVTLHEEVLRAGASAAPRLVTLLQGILAGLGDV